MITLVTLTLSSIPPLFLATASVSNILFNFELALETGESTTLAISSSLRFLFLGAKFFSDSLNLGSGVGGIRWGAVQCEGLLDNGRDTGISTGEGEVEAKLVNQGIVVEVKTQSLDECGRCLSKCGLCL
jgi:hypothetical protein